MMTGNSRIKKDLIAKFANLVEEKNGKFLGVHFYKEDAVLLCHLKMV